MLKDEIENETFCIDSQDSSLCGGIEAHGNSRYIHWIKPLVPLGSEKILGY